MYSVAFNNLEDDESNENAVRVQLLRSNKSFSKKAIVQLDVVPEFSILVALSDSVITVHDIDLSVTSFPVITNLPKTKGASTFALDVSRLKSLSGETVCTVRLVVAVRRKLQLYYWKNRKFLELQADINLPDVPKSLGNSLLFEGFCKWQWLQSHLIKSYQQNDYGATYNHKRHHREKKHTTNFEELKYV